MAKDKEAVAKEGGEATTEEETKSTKAPKPEGFVSPYEFAKQLSERVGREIRPQTVYAQVRNKPKLKDGTEFPVQQNTDGHYMINVEEAFAWYDTRDKEKAAAQAAKAQKEKEAEAEDSDS